MKRVSILISAIVLSGLLMPLCYARAATVTAWGTIQIEGHAMGLNVTGARVELSCAPRPVQNRVWNRFEFNDVPCDTPCELIITMQSPTTGQNVVYRALYRLEKSPLLGGARVRKASGYLGDFFYNPASSAIRYESRY